MAEASRHILLVDDDAELRDVVAALLEDAGYAVTVCVEPDEAIALLSGAYFDLVLTDGFSTTPEGALAATLPLLQAAPGTPVVLFSGHPLPPDDVAAAGFRGAITKPFDIDAFEQRIQAFLGA